MQMRVLFVGNDWAGDHHDVELMDEAGRTLARARLSEGAAGLARLHALIGEHAAGDGEDELEVRVGIETDRGLRVTALEAAGNRAFVLLASCQGSGPAYAGDCQTFSLYSAAAGAATLQQVPLSIPAALRAPQLAQPARVTAASAAVVQALAAVIVTLNQQIAVLERQVEAHFLVHPDAEIVLSQPGLGIVLGARVLAEFGDDPARYASAKARKNYAATSPVTRQSGKRKAVMARYVHNDRLRDALGRQAYSALTASPGARAYYDQLRARGIEHDPALRQLANRLVGILHGCLKSRTLYDEATAWPQNDRQYPPVA